MDETPEDLERVQRLLDDSYERAGAHLLSIHEPHRRLTAERLSEILTGVRVLDLATVTASGEPRVAPVDGLFWRGDWWFGSSNDSVRARHLRARPAVSAAHTVGEELGVVVHGTAVELDYSDPVSEAFKGFLLEVYPSEWIEGGWGSAYYARIEPKAMYAVTFEDLEKA